jgi:hypothetical protein
MSVALVRGAIGSAKVWSPLWSGPVNVSNTTGWQNYELRHQLDLGSFTGIRNGNALRVTWLGGTNQNGIGNAFIGNNVRGTPNFVGNQVRLRFNGSNGVLVPANGLVTSDPVNFPFDPSQPIMVAHELDATAPGGLLYTSAGGPYVTMWYTAAGVGDAANNNMKTPTAIVGSIYGGLFLVEVLGQPVDTWFVGPFTDEPQAFAGCTIRMLIPQNVLPQSGGNRIRLTFQPYISTGGYGCSISDMRIGQAAPGWSRTSPAFAGTPVQVTVNGRTAWDLFALGPPSITSDPINLPMPTSGGLCISAYIDSTPLPTGYMAGGQYQPVGGGTCYKGGNDAATVAASGYTASTYGYMSWLISRIEACTSQPSFSTSYSNFGGRGNRVGLVTPSTTFTFTNPPLTLLIDGAEQTAGVMNGAQSSGQWMFDFGAGAQEYIDEVAWYCGAQTAPQTFAFEGSNDGVNWDRVSTIQTNDAAAPRKIASFVPLTSNRYRYFRMRMIAGVTQASYYQNEVNFKIDPPATFQQSNKLLLHFDGADGSTTATDVSPSAHPITFNGSQCLIKTTPAPKFGTASLQCGTGAAQGGHLTIPYSADFDFGVNDDFTVESQVYLTTVPTVYSMIAGGNSVGWMVELQPTPNWISIWSAAIGYYYFGWPASIDGGSPQANKWYHIAVSRWGNVLLGFVNGVICPIRNVTPYDFSLGAGNLLWVGSVDTHNIIGNLDELCIRKGFAYTGNFTPPTQPYLP